MLDEVERSGARRLQTARAWPRAAQPKNYFLISEAQNGHFVALMLIVEQQKGHSFVVGAAGASGLPNASKLRNLLMNFTSINTANAVITKLTNASINIP